MAEYVELSAKVQGFTHKHTEKECQDSLHYTEVPLKPGKKAYILCVADGHGSEGCPYSADGSRLAVEMYGRVMSDYCDRYQADTEKLMTFLSTGGDIKIAKTIAEDWKNQVKTEHEKQGREPMPEKDGKPDDDGLYHQYGTTLVGLTVMPGFFFAFQLGDGDIAYVDDDGATPVTELKTGPGDNATDSLCLPDAWKYMRAIIRRIPVEFERKPHAFMLFTDGLINSHKNNSEYLKSVKEYFNAIRVHGVETVQNSLEKWLCEISKEGCGDDISSVIAYCDAIPPESSETSPESKETMAPSTDISAITPGPVSHPVMAESVVWLGLVAGIALCVAFSLNFFGPETAITAVSAAHAWFFIFIVFLAAGALWRFFGKGGMPIENDAPILRWGTLVAALLLDILVLAVGDIKNSVTRTLASGFITAGFWSVLLMTFSMGLRLGNPKIRSTETGLCLAALFLHTALLLSQPFFFTIVLQWVALSALCFFAAKDHRLRRWVWGGAATLGACALVFYHTINTYWRSQILRFLSPGGDFYGAGTHTFKLREAVQNAGLLGLDNPVLSDAVQVIPGGATENGFAALCLWQGLLGGALYFLGLVAVLGAMLYLVRSLKPAAMRLALTGVILLVGLSQLMTMISQVGVIVPITGYGLLFLGGWQIQAALAAVWLAVVMTWCSGRRSNIRGNNTETLP